MSAQTNSHDLWRESAVLMALDALDSADRAAFDAHLASCAECRNEVDALKLVTDTLAVAVPQVDPPAALRARVLAAAAGRAPSDAGNAARFAPRDGRADDRVNASSMPSASARRPVPAPYWLGLAATVGLAAGLGVYTTALRGRIATLQADLRTALTQAATQLAQAEDTRRTLISTEERLAVLTATDGRRVALAGQAVAPGASGRADWSPTRGLAVAVGNMPALRPNRTYQVWLLTAGAPVSVGLLEPNADGGQFTVFPAPAGDVMPTGFALSEEPSGGVPAPTGQIYLVGLMASR